MNSGILAQMTVPALPSPPVVSRLLMEEPLLMTGILIVLAVAGFVVFNARGKVKQAIAVGAIGFLLAAGVQVLAAMTETPREKMIKATTALVTATAHADGSRLSPLLDPNVHLSNGRNVSYWPAGADSADRSEVLEKVQKYLGNEYPLEECAVLETQAVVDGPGVGRSQVRVRATTTGPFKVPVVSWWRVDWKMGKDGWVATGIEPLDLGIAGFGKFR